jgi:hypothetical protein
MGTFDGVDDNDWEHLTDLAARVCGDIGPVQSNNRGLRDAVYAGCASVNHPAPQARLL